LSFAAPAFLAALALVPLALLGLWLARRRHRGYAVRFPGTPTLAGLVGPEPRWRRHAPAALFLLALAGLALALARPERTVAVPVERASVVLIMDGSRSMRATDVDPNRLEAAQQAGRRFLDSVPDDLEVGFVGFSDSPHTLERPTVDHEEIRVTLDSLPADGGTATGDALDAALAMVAGQRPAKGKRPPAAIVMLSDGKQTLGIDPIPVARRAGKARVPVYTVSLGTTEGVVQADRFGGSLPVPPDPATMRRIARLSGGEAFKVEDSGELDKIYERLGSSVGTRKEKRELTAGFAAGGIGLLLAATALGLRWSGRLP